MKKFLQSILIAVVLLFSTTVFVACGSPDITKISINPGPQVFEVGNEYTFTATLTPKDASSEDIAWSSSNTAVASINKKGKVTAKSAGSTIITAMSKNNSNVKDTYTLIVRGKNSNVVLLSKTYVYDGTPKSLEASAVQEGIELRYTYQNASYSESEYAPVDAGEYLVTAYNKITGDPEATANMIINKKQISLAIGDYTKKYSEDDPTFVASVSGLIGEDTLTYTLERTAGENVETYRIFANITEHKNYTVSVSEGRLTIQQLQVKIIVDNKKSIYGDTLLTPTYNLQDMSNNLLDASLQTQIVGSPQIEKPAGVTRLPFGSYAIVSENLTSSNLDIVARQNGTYIIEKRAVTIAIGAEQYKYAGNADPTLVYAIDGTLEGDDLSGCLSRTPGEMVGFYEYHIDQTLDTNYIISTEAGATNYKFEIKSNVVEIAFDTFEINYSSTNKEDYIPADYYKYTITINDVEIDYSTDEAGNIYVSPTDSIVLGHEVTKVEHLTDEEKVGYYQKWKVVLSKISTNGYTDPSKYTFTFVEGFKYLKLLDLNVYAATTYKIYGEVDPELTYYAEGFIDDDDEESVFKTVELKRANGENVTPNGYAITRKSDIELNDSKTYYKPIFNEGLFVIEKRELRVTPVSYTADNPIYYGEAPRALEIDTQDLNLATRDNLASVLVGELSRPDNENVGQYPILDTNLRLTDAAKDNYYITYTPGVYTIIPRPLVVTAIDKTIQYGEEVSKYQYSYDIVDEFIYIDEDEVEQIDLRLYTIDNPTFSGNLSLTSYGLKYANHTYTIGQGTLTAGGNFTITFVQGTLTVVPREVTVSFTAQSYGFTEFDEISKAGEVIDALVYSFKPGLAYRDYCIITHCGITSQEGSSIISINKDAEENYEIEFQFLAGDGTILDSCYNVTIDENYTELFYLGASLLEIKINNVAGGQTVEKTYGDSYKINEVFTIISQNPDYRLEYTEKAFNIKGVTEAATKATDPSYQIDAGSYTVTIFADEITIFNSQNQDVSENFAFSIKEYGSLVINKANLTMDVAPTVSSIVYGTAKPNFNGGTYSFVNQNGGTILINGSNEEYSTSSTATYAVQTNAHLIMATFTSSNKNFNPVTINNLELYVTKAYIDTTVLEWSFGASVEKKGTLDAGVYTTATNIDGVSNTVYDGVYTTENLYNIPTSLPNYRFLRQTLGSLYSYKGITFHNEEGGDTGFMYYIDNPNTSPEVKKVFPADSTRFYVKLNKTTKAIEFYYNDGSKDYLLTNTNVYETDEDIVPKYWESVYSPKLSGVFIAQVELSSLNDNYAVADIINNPATTEETIFYYNVFMVEKLRVDVYNFTDTIVYDSPLEFYYITDPEEIYGVTLDYWKKGGGDVYSVIATPPTDVGEYAVTFLIDQDNYYYYQELCYFEIVPIEITVEWDEESTFNFISTDTKISRAFKIFAGDDLLFDSKVTNPADAPTWLRISYTGVMANGNNYTQSSAPIKDIVAATPSNAGNYTIAISASTDNKNYTGGANNTYAISPIFYNGAITIIRGTMMYDVKYDEEADGAKQFYDEIKAKMIQNATEDDWAKYDLSLSYLGHVIDPTGADNTAVGLLNRAGGPYRITLSIKSYDGNIKETLKTANLTVNKANVPTMAQYDSTVISIPFTGNYVYNALTKADRSENYVPQTYNPDDMSYTYEHKGNMTNYFGIIYKYYKIWNIEEANTSNPSTAPIVPEDTGAYMVVATIITGANYNPPTQTTYTGYFRVVKTTVTLTADNQETTYTGQEIPIPDVVAKNGVANDVTIKYEDDEDTIGLYVSVEIKDASGNVVNKITKAGTYTVTYNLEDRENFLTAGSTFTTTCTIIVKKKPIDGIEKFIVKAEEFVSTELVSVLYINPSAAFDHDSNYSARSSITDTASNQFYIQLYVTDATDGSGNIWPITSRTDRAIENLPAGTYYYYVGVKPGVRSTYAISNYTNSAFIPFEVKRSDVQISVKDGFEDGYTLDYNTTNQGYDINCLNIVKISNGNAITGLTEDDFIIEYKLVGAAPEVEFTTVKPILNGTYTVMITLRNGNYESNQLETSMIINSPTLTIDGSGVSFVYGFIGDVSISLTATGAAVPDTLSFDGNTNKYNDAALTTEHGWWFVVRDNFGVYTSGGAIADDYTLAGSERVVGSSINNGLANYSTPLYTISELSALNAGIYKMLVVYVSKDTNFAITFAEVTLNIISCSITSDAITGSATEGIELVGSEFKHAEHYSAESQYSSGAWGYSSQNIVETFTFNVNVKVKGPFAADYTGAETKVLALTVTINSSITGEQIKNAFESTSATATTGLSLSSNVLKFVDDNYSLADSVLNFVLETIFEKQTTTAFTEKLVSGELQPVEYTYGAVFLDEYWANLNEKSRGSTDYPDSVINNTNHIYLFNLINLPTGGAVVTDNNEQYKKYINDFRSAWTIDSDDAMHDLYSFRTYVAEVNDDGSIKKENGIPKKGAEKTYNTTYINDSDERATGIYHFYRYDIDKETDAGLYVVEIKLKTSDYFLETTLHALVRVKPTTYYARTSLDGYDGLIDTTKADSDKECIKIYPSATDNSVSAKSADYTISYYTEVAGQGEKLVYKSEYTHGDNKYTAKTTEGGGTYGTYASMVAAVSGAKKFRVAIKPSSSYANSIYVEDINILVINGSIDLGYYNIYDELNIVTLASEADDDSPLKTLYDMSDMSDNCLRWSEDINNVLAKSGNSLTEESLGFMHMLDQARDAASGSVDTSDSTKFKVTITPDSNNQLVLGKLPLNMTLADGSLLSVTVKFVVNLKLITKTDTFNFEYNGNPQAPNITAYFQGWVLTIPISSGAPDINNLVVAEKLNGAYTAVTPTVVYINKSSGNRSTTKPTNAGNYAVESTFEVNFANYGEEVTFVCENDFSISKIEATITLESKEVLYNGETHLLTATPSVTGLDCSVKYYPSDSSDPITTPRDANVYYVVATIDDDNYFGTAVATLTIKATSTQIIITMPANQTFTGGAISPTYKVLNDAHEDITAKVSSNIRQTWSGLTYQPHHAGAYEYKVELSGSKNYLPNSATANYVIDRAAPRIEITPPANFTYTGNAIQPTYKLLNLIGQDITADSTANLKVTYNDLTTPPVNAGVYKMYIVYTPPADNQDYLPIDASYTFEILPQALEVSYRSYTGAIVINYSNSMTLDALNPIYEEDAEVKFSYKGYEYNADGTLSTTQITSTTFPSHAGVYSIIAEPDSVNYTGRVSTTLVIARATPTITIGSNISLAYTGEGRSPTISYTETTLTYNVLYTGTTNLGEPYSNANKPVNAGNYVVTISYAGNKDYAPTTVSRGFEITKITNITLKFEELSMSQEYTGSALKPTVKAYLVDEEKTALADSIVITYGEDTTTPVDAGTYVVKAYLVDCNYSAEMITGSFVINKSDDYTVTLTNSGNLAIGASSIGAIEMGGARYTIHYTGKTYLEDGTLSSTNNYDSFNIPAIPGEYVAEILSDNYKTTTHDFKILKKDVTASLAFVDYNLSIGTVPNLPETITLAPDTYKVVYTYKAEGATEFTSTAPITLGNHTIKMTVCSQMAMGEAEAEYNILSDNAAVSKVVLASKYYMYDGNDIVVTAYLYLNGVLQTDPQKDYKLNGTTVTHVNEVGEYEIILTASAQSFSSTFTVLPAISLSTPTNGETFTGSAMSVSCSFVSAANQTQLGSKLSYVIMRDGFTVAEVKDAGHYVVSALYEGYPVFTKEFTINKKIITGLTQSKIEMTYGDMAAIPTHISTYKVTYTISLSGTTAYQAITPTVGEHKIKFTINERNYQGECIADLSVSKKVLKLDIDDFSVEYTGEKIVMPNYIANFEYLTYKYKKSDSAGSYLEGLPSEVGTYYIQAMSHSPNYAVGYNEDARPYIIVEITKATPVFVVSNMTQVYDGEVKVPTAIAIYNGKTYTTNASNSNIKDAGSYEIYFTVSTNTANFNQSANYTFVVEKKEVEITYTLPENMVYDEHDKVIEPSSGVEGISVQTVITKDGITRVPNEAGTYIATFTTNATTNYKAAQKVITFDILPAPSIVTCVVDNYTYSDSPKIVDVTTSPFDATEADIDITYNTADGNAPTEAGTYIATIVVTPTDTNYSIETVEFEYTIVKAMDTITYSGAEHNYFYYDGSKKAIVPSAGSGIASLTYQKANSAGVYQNVTPDDVKDPGDYKAIIVSNGNNNFYSATKTVFFSIYKEKLASSIAGKTVVYDGDPHGVYLTEDPNHTSGLVKILYSGKYFDVNGLCNKDYAESETEPREPGIYTAKLQAKEDKYTISGNATATLIIKRQELDVRIDIAGVDANATIIDYTGAEFTVKAMAMVDGTDTDLSTKVTDAVIVRFVGTETSIKLQSGGAYELISNINSQHYIGYCERLITIKPQGASIFATQTVINYTGKAVTPGFIVVSSDGTDITAEVATQVQITYYNQAGEPTTPINAGKYTANIVLVNSSYSANATYTFTIIETMPELQYRITGSDIVYLNTSSSTGLELFDPSHFSVLLAGETLENTAYTVKYQQDSTEVVDGEIVSSWSDITLASGQKIEADGAYRIIITISNPDSYISNLIGTEDEDGEEVLTWAFLFYVSTSDM